MNCQISYQKFIDQIINDRGQWGLGLDLYKEQHHILPKCLGGESDTINGKFKKNSKHPNCIWLTAKEHFIAHKLLMQEHPDNLELKAAYCAMAFWKSDTQYRDYELSAEEYEEARLIASEINKIYHTGKKYSEETIEKRRTKTIGQTRTAEAKAKMSKAAFAFYEEETAEHREARIDAVRIKTKEAMWSPEIRQNYLAAYFSEETRLKQKAGIAAFYASEAGQLVKQQQSERRKGKRLSEETKQKISEAQRGKVLSEETKQRMSDAAKARPQMSDETKYKLSQAHKGKKFSNEHIEKIRLTKIGKKQSADVIQRRTEAGKPIRELLKTKYAEYKACNGPLKWNDFQKVYQEIGEEIFNDINNGTEK